MADKLGAAPPKPKRGGARKDDGRAVNNAQAAEEAEEAQYLSFLGQAQKQQLKVDAAKAVLDQERATLASIFGVAKGQGHQRQELEEDLKDLAAMDNPASRREVTLRESRRIKRRTWAGLPTGQRQGDLIDDNPAKDEIEWEAQGYSDSLRNLPLVTPADCPAGGCAQAYATGWHNGEAKKAWADSNAALPGSASAPKPAVVPPSDRAPVEAKSSEPPALSPTQTSEGSNVVPLTKAADDFDMSDAERAAQTPRPRAEPEEESV